MKQNDKWAEGEVAADVRVEQIKKKKRDERNVIIEECAKVAEVYESHIIADAIRNLKNNN